MSYEIAIIPALAAIVYTLIDVTKTALGGDEKFKRFIPLIAMVLGAVCGVVAFYCVQIPFRQCNVELQCCGCGLFCRYACRIWRWTCL